MKRLPSLLDIYFPLTKTQNFQCFCSILKADRSYLLHEFRYNTCPVHVHGTNVVIFDFLEIKAFFQKSTESPKLEFKVFL